MESKRAKLPNVGTVDEAVGIAASTRIRNNTIKLAKLFIAVKCNMKLSRFSAKFEGVSEKNWIIEFRQHAKKLTCNIFVDTLHIIQIFNLQSKCQIIPKAVRSGLSGGSQKTTNVRQARNTHGIVSMYVESTFFLCSEMS